MNAYRNASFAGIILGLIGAVVVVYGLVNLGTEMDLSKKGQTATGTVIDLNVVEPYRQAIVRFQTAEGDTVTFIDKLFWNNAFETYKVGQEVEVIYDPAMPNQTATINQFFQRNTAPWWPVILGAVVILVGIIMRKGMLKKAKILDGQMNGTIAVDPDAGRKARNKAALIAAIGAAALILLLIIVFGVYGS